MKKYRNLISSILSLFLTVFLLAFTIYGWYTSNKNVSVHNVVGATSESKDLYISSTFIPGIDQTTFTQLDNSVWDTNVNVNSNNLLLPVSTVDAQNFYYAYDINSNGTAKQTDDDYEFVKVNTSKNYYYIEKSIYFCYIANRDADGYLKVINIEQGSDKSSEIYKAVRVYFEDADDTTDNKMFKYKNQTAYPAVSTTAVSDYDPAINDGVQYPDNFNFHLTGAVKNADVTTYTFKKINMKIWIEGQAEKALSTYSGTGFKISLMFATYN